MHHMTHKVPLLNETKLAPTYLEEIFQVFYLFLNTLASDSVRTSFVLSRYKYWTH